MSYCEHSFFFFQDYLPPSMGELKDKTVKFASQQPIKFVALATFVALGGVPIGSFLAYSIVTVIASLIGAVLVELFLLVIGVAALAFVLCFVGCVTACVTMMATALYYGFCAAYCTWTAGKRGSSLLSSRYHPARSSDQHGGDDDDETFDKSK